MDPVFYIEWRLTWTYAFALRWENIGLHAVMTISAAAAFLR